MKPFNSLIFLRSLSYAVIFDCLMLVLRPLGVLYTDCLVLIEELIVLLVLQFS